MLKNPLAFVRVLLVALSAAGLLLSPAPARASGGTWTALNNQPPFQGCEMQLLTDGRVLVQGYYTDASCWILSPDSTGSYVNGTWKQAASMHDWRLYYASSVFADGRVIVAGGEYSSAGSWGAGVEIYDPKADAWTKISPPSGWSNIGDACCMVLPNGKFLLGSDFDASTAIYDPAAGTWSAGPNMLNSNSDEATWALMPNNVVEMVDAFDYPGTQAYVFPNNTWVNTGNTPSDLVDPSSLELGPSMLMGDGRLFQFGATPNTAVYTSPSNPLNAGSWATGPTPPTVSGSQLVCADAPCAWLPNGKILVCMGPYSAGGFGQPIYFCETDGTSIYQVQNPGNAGGVPYNDRLLLLPNGQVLCSASSNSMYVYTPDGTPNTAYAPTVTSVPSTLTPGTSYQAAGTQFNGVTQGTSYGDDSWNPTNYPLVRIVNNSTGVVTYCRTHDHSTMAVATGGATVSTTFDVPSSIPVGASTLYLVADGVASAGVPVTVGSQQPVLPTGFSILRGSFVSGSLNSLYYNDGSSLVVGEVPVIANALPQIVVRAVATAPSKSPNSLSIQLASSVNTPNLLQSVALYNFKTKQYETVDARLASTSDTVITVSASGDLSRFVDQNSLQLQMTVSYNVRGTVSSSNWRASLDEINWLIG